MSTEVAIRLIENVPDILLGIVFLIFTVKAYKILKVVNHINQGTMINAQASRALLQIFSEVQDKKNPVFVGSLISILNDEPSLPVEVVDENGDRINLMNGKTLDKDKALALATFSVKNLYITVDCIMIEIKRNHDDNEEDADAEERQ